MSQARHKPVIDVLHDAIDALERQEFWHGLAQDYERLQSDPQLWEQYVAERSEWDRLG